VLAIQLQVTNEFSVVRRKPRTLLMDELGGWLGVDDPYFSKSSA
jgi:hypothetical protein